MPAKPKAKRSSEETNAKLKKKKLNNTVDILHPVLPQNVVIAHRNLHSNNLLSKLSKDEMGEIFNFLSGKDILDLAFTSANYFNFVMEWAKVKYPFALQQSVQGIREIAPPPNTSTKKRNKYKTLEIDGEWTLVRALKRKDFLLIGDDNYEMVFSAFKQVAEQHGGNLDLITHCFKLKTVDRMDELFSINIPNSDSEMQLSQLPHVRIERGTNYEILKGINIETKDIIEKQVHGTTIGSKIKELWLDGCVHAFSLFRTLDKCPSLETLVLKIAEDDNKDFDEFEDSKFMECSVLNSLKYLEIDSQFTEEYEHQFIIDILKLAPNLESFDCKFHTACPFDRRHVCGDDTFLKYLSKMCPNLKELRLSAEFCEESEPLEISDEGLDEFLNSQPKLEYIDIDSSKLSGEIFAKIGEFSQLETILVNRCNGELTKKQAPQCAKLVFGGGMLMNLKTILIGDDYELSEEEKQAARQTLYKIAPKVDQNVDIFVENSDEEE